MRIISKAGLAGSFMMAVLITMVPYARAQAPAPPADARPESGGKTAAAAVADGKKLYNSYGCYQCHGYAGQGGTGTKLAPSALSYAGFSKYTREPKGQMPPYTLKVLKESELEEIYAFLKTIPKSPDPKTIPLLNSD